MTPFIHLLTTTAIFVHATLGCCAHETHGVAGNRCEPTDCCDSELHGQVNESQHQAIGHSQHSLNSAYLCQSQQSESHQCEHALCSWSAPDSRSSVELMLQTSLECIHGLQSTSPASFLARGRISLLLTSNPDPPATLSKHLAYGVLLI